MEDQVFWEEKFIEISKTVERRMYNLNELDLFAESYIYLFEHYINNGLVLPNKTIDDNVRMYTCIAKRHILNLARKCAIRHKYEVYSDFDEELALAILDEKSSNNISTEDKYDFEEYDMTELEIKLNKLMVSKHSENRQLGLLARCLIDLSKFNLSRKVVIEKTLAILDIRIARFYELERLLKTFLNYRR